MDKQLATLSRVLYTDLDTPVALGAFLRLKYQEWDQLAAMAANPAHYLDTSIGAAKYLKDVQAASLLRKFPGLETSWDTKRVAEEGFLACEKSCALTNRNLVPFLLNYGLTAEQGRIFDFIDDVKRLVRKILGPLPEDLNVRFGPGATFESKGHRHAANYTVADKMSEAPTLTPDALCLSGYIYRTAWGRELLRGKPHDSAPRIARGNRFTTVPKDATKDRGICIEPGGNVCLQLAIGRVIRSRLLRFGIDLNNGQHLHRALAREGSLAGALATCDLSNASDTVAKNLVKLLLPEDWFELLSSVRSTHTLFRGKWIRLEKFSSMGNGYTFELETLLFGAIVSCASRARLGQQVYVYGDDIIYPASSAADVLAALRWFGFQPNAKKSFSTGPFRESCGGDFFMGYPVRPYFLDKDVNEPHEWISLHNGLRRAADQLSTDFTRRARNRALGNLPAVVKRCRGPRALGDLVIHDDDESKWSTSTRNSIRYVLVWRPVLRRIPLKRWIPEVQFATILYGSAEGCFTNTLERIRAALDDRLLPEVVRDAVLIPRNGVSGYRTGRVAYS